MALVKKTDVKQTFCIICGKPSTETICPTCQARIRGEAVEKKQEIEKKGHTEQGRT